MVLRSLYRNELSGINHVIRCSDVIMQKLNDSNPCNGTLWFSNVPGIAQPIVLHETYLLFADS